MCSERMAKAQTSPQGLEPGCSLPSVDLTGGSARARFGLIPVLYKSLKCGSTPLGAMGSSNANPEGRRDQPVPQTRMAVMEMEEGEFVRLGWQ